MSGEKMRAFPRLIAAALAAMLASGLVAGRAAAVPAFAEQTGQPCVGCHVGGFGPQLTPFGRAFKLGGYTLRTNSFNVPLSAMAVASYIRTQKGQPSPPASSFRDNDNFALDQASLFLAGGLGQHFGGFVQATYDGVARAFHWDNLDLRAVTTATVKGVNVVLGLSANNAPSVQDAFNTLPSWAFPYTTSGLAPSPGSAPLIGSLAQNTIGLTGYAWINSELYAELGAYKSPSARFLTQAGVDPTDPGAIEGAAPYARVAYNKNFGDSNVEAGAFWMNANLFPGLDRTTGMADHYTDWGLDGSYQLFAAKHDVFTINGRYIYETQALDPAGPPPRCLLLLARPGRPDRQRVRHLGQQRRSALRGQPQAAPGQFRRQPAGRRHALRPGKVAARATLQCPRRRTVHRLYELRRGQLEL